MLWPTVVPFKVGDVSYIISQLASCVKSGIDRFWLDTQGTKRSGPTHTPYPYYATAVLRIWLSRGETVVVLLFGLRFTGK